MNISSILLIISLLFISAKDGCNKKEAERAEGIVGQWRWVKGFCCGRTSKWSYQETCDCKKSIEFTADGRYMKYDRDVLVKEGVYRLRKGLNDYLLKEGDDRDAIVFGEYDAAYLLTKGDTLGITFGYMDGPNDYYVRKEESK
jgi:hypothetical protein